MGWEASGEEGEGHRHLVHTVIQRICDNEDRIASLVEKEVQKSDETLWRRKEPEPEPEAVCPNAKRARSEEKEAKLTRMRAVLEKFRQESGHEVETLIGFLHKATMQLRAPFSLLSRAKAMVFMSPHDRGKALF